ncbi:hypothetical protein AWL63_23085 (plasmid) [Sphingomonas panacis]|uniref:Uncharacterized protein n=1 Tax=Sphingomonas panacis TaxID=1560345 RepID=A0A1B3ZI19_9SPHN|nr:hypothetical protein AWL63_23085 [Sphingomonas panacis]
MLEPHEVHDASAQSIAAPKMRLVAGRHEESVPIRWNRQGQHRAPEECGQIDARCAALPQ